MKNKIIGIFVCMLLISSSVSTLSGSKVIDTTSKPLSREKTLYVGGNGLGNYTTIQDAINDASDGDTVFVYDDSSPYYENVVIGKSINLIGEDKITTIIDGQNKKYYDTVLIVANFVMVSGFTIQHCGTLIIDAGIEIDSKYCTIKDNIITLNEDNGILLNGNGNTISGNIITQNHGDWYTGIRLIGSDDNLFVDNNIYENGYGFSIHHSNNNSIKDNIIHDNYNEEGNFGAGIWMEFCNNNLICCNNISNNHGRGIDLYESNNNNIYNNTLIGNGWGTVNGTVGGDGISLRVNSTYNIVRGNLLRKNKRDGLSIYRDDTSYNVIIENVIEDSDRYGIEVSPYYPGSLMYNTFYHNNFANNTNDTVKDTGVNTWINSYPSGGNYWADYNGVDYYRGPDQDIPGSDGIGDKPYNISGGNHNQDLYPLIKRWGENPPYADFIYTGDDVTFSFNASFSFDRDGTIESYKWDFGDNTTGTGEIIEHTYASYGNYTVNLTITDGDGKTNSVSRAVIENNSPPSIPTFPMGPRMVEPYIFEKFYTKTKDPNKDKIQYRFDWDADGSHDYSGLTGLIPSNIEANMSHRWDTIGTYMIKVQACDEHGFASDWSIGLTVLVNNPPKKPSNPKPINETTGVDIDADLSWKCNDPDGDNITYDVYFGESSPPPRVAPDLNKTTYDPGTMKPKTTYYWQIVAEDEHTAVTKGPIWYFITGSKPNNPPYIPTNPHPENKSRNVDVDINLSWTGGDPDENDTVVYDLYLEADDPTPDVLIAEDISDTKVDPGYLQQDTTYYWKIVAEDNYYAETEGPIWQFTTSKPDLGCNGSLSWTRISPGSTVSGGFTISNIGESRSLLKWKVSDWPDWGTWTFSPLSGIDLVPGELVTVNVSVVAPDNKNSKFTGEITIVNKENASDFCTIDVSLTTPKVKPINFHFNLLEWLFERFPHAFPILRYVLTLVNY